MSGCEIGKRLAQAFLVGVMLAGLQLAAAAELTEDQEPAAVGAAPRVPIELDEVEFGSGGTVSGVLINRSASVLRDVRLLVRYDWQWENEREPGEDSPARSTYVTVQGDIPALGTRPFRFAPASPLPARSDGRFSPSVEVARYTQVGYKRGSLNSH